MTNVIDSFVVEIGLDPKNFTKGQREALDAFKKTQEEALKGGKAIEDQSKKTLEALGGIKTQALGLLAVVTGATGIAEFVKQTISAGASVGRLSRNLGVSATTISQWQGVARVFGGTAEGMAQSFTAVSDAFAGWKVGIISPLVADFRAISTAGGKTIEINKGVQQSILDLADNLKAIHDRDPALAGLLGRRIGLDPALFDALIQGSGKLAENLKSVAAWTDADAEAAGRLDRRWNELKVNTERGAQKLLFGAIDRFAQAWDWQISGGKRSGTTFTQPSVNSEQIGAFSSQSDKEAFIRSEAVKRGLDPDVMVKVAKSEGFDKFLGDNGTSGGAFQLHVTPGGKGNAVGDQFAKATGKSPLDPANEALAIQFALDDIRAHGLSAYHGAARVGLGPSAGGAGQGGSTTSTSISVNGPITINAGPNADGAAIAGKFTETLKRQSFAAQANDGQN